jgi:hypothetical protein
MSLISPRSKPLIALHLDASGLRAEKHPKAVSTERRLEARARREVYRQVGNMMVEARKFSGLAVDTLVAIAKDGQTDNSRLNAAVELLNRGYGRPAQSGRDPPTRHAAVQANGWRHRRHVVCTLRGQCGQFTIRRNRADIRVLNRLLGGLVGLGRSGESNDKRPLR